MKVNREYRESSVRVRFSRNIVPLLSRIPSLSWYLGLEQKKDQTILWEMFSFSVEFDMTVTSFPCCFFTH